MTRLATKYFAFTLGLLICWAVGDCSRADAQGFTTPKPESKPSMTDSITSGFQKGLQSIGDFISPKPAAPAPPKEDPVSLSNEAKPTPKLFTAIARFHHQAGRLSEAAKHYQKALQLDSQYMGAMLGYARLNEQMGRPEVAMQLYQAAAKVHPDKAPVFNNIGLSYLGRGNYDEAAKALARAVQLEPRNAKYRNNIASALVKMGRNREAYSHLRVVHDHPISMYNMGFLLKQKGDTEMASQHFAAALRAKPDFVAARQELAALKGGPRLDPPGQTARVTPPPQQQQNPVRFEQQPRGYSPLSAPVLDDNRYAPTRWQPQKPSPAYANRANESKPDAAALEEISRRYQGPAPQSQPQYRPGYQPQPQPNPTPSIRIDPPQQEQAPAPPQSQMPHRLPRASAGRGVILDVAPLPDESMRRPTDNSVPLPPQAGRYDRYR